VEIIVGVGMGDITAAIAAMLFDALVEHSDIRTAAEIGVGVLAGDLVPDQLL
jgi:hypothetical protein